jgi:uncharacterized protein YcbX
MAGTLAHICRHPIKSVGWEDLERVDLTPDRCLPWDRHWAITHGATRFDPRAPGWRPKQDFVRGVAAAPLMAVSARLDPAARRLRLAHPDRPVLEISPDTPEGSDALVAWIAPLWPDTRPPPEQLVSAGPAQALTDQDRPLISVLNCASLRDLSGKMGQELSRHRVRGNLWVDGLTPWVEFDWIGKTIEIGPVTLRIEERIPRCLAINGNPDSGVADIDMFAALDQHYGHNDFGVFARVVGGGQVVLGDPVAPA